MKEEDYKAILGIKTRGEFYDLGRREGEKIHIKKEEIRRSYTYISPLTSKLLLNQMNNFVESRGCFPDKSKDFDMFSEVI